MSSLEIVEAGRQDVEEQLLQSSAPLAQAPKYTVFPTRETESVQEERSTSPDTYDEEDLPGSLTVLDYRQNFSKSIDIRLHDAAHSQDKEEMQRLLAAGASVAALDRVGITPLHQCITFKQLQCLKFLLKCEGSVEVKDVNGWPLLHAAILHRWPAGVRALLEAGADVTSCPAYPERYYDCARKFGCIGVTRRDYISSFTKTPMHLAVEIDGTEIFDIILKAGVIECLDKNGQTPLLHAVDVDNLYAVRSLVENSANVMFKNREEQTIWHAAVGKPHILKYILNHVYCDEAEEFYDSGGDTPLHRAVRLKETESVRLFLDAFKNLRVRTKVWEQTPLHVAAEVGCNGSAEMILNHDQSTMNELDLLEDTPLHTAAKNNNRIITVMLLRNGDVLGRTGKRSAVDLISFHFSDASSFFAEVFDEFVNAKKQNDCYEVEVDYKVLTDDANKSQIGVIEEFVKCGQSNVLIHPLVESLLYFKWCQLLPLFYSIVAVFVTFLISLNIFVVTVYYRGNDTFNSSAMNGTICVKTRWCQSRYEIYWILVILIDASVIILLIQESFHIYLRRLRYFTHLESWVKCIGLGLGALAPATACLQQEWPRHAACAALLLSWLQATFLLARIPHWGNYILMFGKVAINMLKIFVTSIFLVIAFSLCFLIQYQWTPPFEGPFAAVIKTLIMMTSEFDYENLTSKDHANELENSKTIVRLLFVVFQLFMAIVLMNFMIGVAVSDINDLNMTSNVNRLEKQVELLSTLEFLLLRGTRTRCLWLKNAFRLLWVNRSLWKMYFVYGKQTKNHVTCHDSSELGRKYFVIPSPVLKAIADIAMKKVEEVNRDSAETVREYKINALYDAIVDRPVEIKRKYETKPANDLISLREIILRQEKHLKVLSTDLQKELNDLRSELRSIKKILAKEM